MLNAFASAGSRWSRGLVRSLSDKEFRDAYVEDNVRTGIAFQIRALREQRGWSQSRLAELVGTSQSAISRAEDPDYGKLSLQTLLEIAAVFDIALLVQFVEWEDWLTRTADVSPAALEKKSFDLGRLLMLAGQASSHKTCKQPPTKVRKSMLCFSEQSERQSVGTPPQWSDLLDGKQCVGSVPPQIDTTRDNLGAHRWN